MVVCSAGDNRVIDLASKEASLESDHALLERPDPDLIRSERLLRALIDRLRPGFGRLVRIRFTNNSCTMVSK